jgi:predicted DNA-binding transcriptional regulator YafY/effector-binding domain-containing protein
VKIDRLLSIVIHLLGRDLVSATSLAERFGVTVRTIQRDVDAINAAGIPVTALHGPNGGYKILDTFSLDRQYLTFDDLFFMSTALQGISDLMESPTVERTADKIRSMARRTPSREMESRAERLYIDFKALGYSSWRKEHMALIQDAVARGRCLSFSYTNARLESSVRVVEPYAIVFKWYSWYLFGWCRERKDFRLFRLSRIRDPRLRPEAFRRRPVSVAGYLEDMAAQAPAPVPVVLRFKPELRVLVEDRFSYADLSTGEDGSVIARLDFPEDNWLYGMILSWGDGVEVLSPDHLRGKIVEICERTRGVYGEIRHTAVVYPGAGSSRTSESASHRARRVPMEIKVKQEQKTACVRFRSTVEGLKEEIGGVYGEVMGLLGQQGVQPAGAPFAIYHNMDMKDLDVEAGFPVAGPFKAGGRVRQGVIPGGRTVVAVHKGPYDQMHTVYNEITALIAREKAVPTGLCYEVYLSDPQVTKPEDLLTEVDFPLKG